jgi:hypothetical protein
MEFQIVEKGIPHWNQRTEVSRFRRRSEPSDLCCAEIVLLRIPQGANFRFPADVASFRKWGTHRTPVYSIGGLSRASREVFIRAELHSLSASSCCRCLTSCASIRPREPSSFRRSPEAMLVDFQRPNLRFQRGPRDAQLGRSLLGSEYPAATFF